MDEFEELTFVRGEVDQDMPIVHVAVGRVSCDGGYQPLIRMSNRGTIRPAPSSRSNGRVESPGRLGGLLRYYYREAG